MKQRKKLFVIGVLGVLVGLFAVTATGLGANEGPDAYDATLELSLQSNSGQWTADGPLAGLQEGLSRQGCTLKESGDDLIDITGFGSGTAFAGFKKGAIGTKDSNDGNGEPCARVEAPAESLELALGSDVTGPGFLANGGQLALSFKFDATATIELFLGGTAVRAPIVLPCDGGSDCGPDSGLSDVGIVEIPVSNDPADFFDAVMITSTGSVSLVSAVAPNDTHIHVVAPPVTIEGTVFHDRDKDGFRDSDFFSDEGLDGFTVAAFDVAGDQVGVAEVTVDGEYVITGLPRGATYSICISPPNLPTPPGSVDFAWAQVDLSIALDPNDEYLAAQCAVPVGPGDPFSADGWKLVNLQADRVSVDFANIDAAQFECTNITETAIIDSPPESGLPSSTLEFTCNKAGGLAVEFDAGVSNNEEFDQFVTVGLPAIDYGANPDAPLQAQRVDWAEEPAVYENSALTVKTTKVIIPGAGAEDVRLCEANGLPLRETGKDFCLRSQTINVGGDVSPNNIQVTENYEYFGDPLSFR